MHGDTLPDDDDHGLDGLMMSGAIFWVLDFLGSGFWELF
jgi:hypothetical protein